MKNEDRMTAYKPKIEQTKKFVEDGVGAHDVTEVKLLLIELDGPKYEEGVVKKASGAFYHPYLISESEEIKPGDKAYCEGTKHVYDVVSNSTIAGRHEIPAGLTKHYFYKILALPEQFSDVHLSSMAVAERVMNDGDELLLKCEDASQETQGLIDGHYTHLDSNNHVTLFIPPATTVDDKIERLVDDFTDAYQRRAFGSENFKPLLRKTLKEMHEWTKDNE